jgi:hypothetical protein
MGNFITEAWDNAADCTALAEKAVDLKTQELFRILAKSWARIAAHRETLQANDDFLAQLPEP